MSCQASEKMLSCTECNLHEFRTQVVGGHGSRVAEIAFVAEAPGHQEDIEGLPLVGPAGKRFDLELAAAGLARDEVWLDNSVHCRPPNNAIREYPNALARCPSLWLFPTLAQLPNLKAVVAMGATAGGLWFSGKKATEIAGLTRATKEYIVCGSFHPSYALRSGGSWNEVDNSIVASIKRAMVLGGVRGR